MVLGQCSLGFVYSAMADFDVERLIEAVRSRPIIWDSSHEHYKNRNKKRDSWSEVCAAMVPEFQEKSDIEKNNIGNDVQTRWKSLRDRHIRYLCENKCTKSGSAAKPKKTYIYAKHLEFLRVTMAHNMTEDSQHDDENGDQNIQNEPEDEVATATLVGDEGTLRITNTQYKRKKAKLEDKLETYIDVMVRREALMEVVNDEDLGFFRSLLPKVKRLPIDDKLQFQSDVLHLLIRYNNKVQSQQQFGLHQQYGAQTHYGPQQHHGPHQSNPQNLFMAQQPGGANSNFNTGQANAPDTFNYQPQFSGSSTFTGNNDQALDSGGSPINSETSDSLLSLH